MASISDITQSVYEDVGSVLDSMHTEDASLPNLDSAFEHVGVRDEHDFAVYPRVVIDVFQRPNPKGMDGSVHVDHVEEDAAGSESAVIYRKDSTARVDLTVITDNDDAKQRDRLLSVLSSHFDAYLRAKDATALHDDAQEVRTQPPPAGGGSERLTRSVDLRYDIDFGAFRRYDDFVPMESVDIQIEVENDDGSTTPTSY